MVNCKEAFVKSKQAMTSDTLLVRYKPKLQIKLSYCDVSEYGKRVIIFLRMMNRDLHTVHSHMYVQRLSTTYYNVYF